MTSRRKRVPLVKTEKDEIDTGRTMVESLESQREPAKAQPARKEEAIGDVRAKTRFRLRPDSMQTRCEAQSPEDREGRSDLREGRGLRDARMAPRGDSVESASVEQKGKRKRVVAMLKWQEAPSRAQLTLDP
ncbi:hypothetical protein KM043_005689 [Ampulex compressa]|nr:hypothetical protein KM043_005689 [Ampulex compressa]